MNRQQTASPTASTTPSSAHTAQLDVDVGAVPDNNVTEPVLYLHIGLPKAGSSYLHDHVFRQLMPGRYLMPGARYAKLPAYRYKRNRYGVRRFSDAFQRDPKFWDQHGDDFFRQFLSSFFEQGRARESVLICDEAITRLNHFGIRGMPDAFERERLRQNLAAFDRQARRFGFARTRILLMIRRQDVLLASSYVQLSRKILGASQQDFERRVARLISGESSGSNETFYPMEYAKLHECITSVLPAEDVCFLPIESISNDFEQFARTLERFLNVQSSETLLSRQPSNARSKGRNRWALRPLLAFKSPQRSIEVTVPPALTGRGSEIELRTDTAETIRQHYAEENRRVSDVIAPDLGDYGYF